MFIALNSYKLSGWKKTAGILVLSSLFFFISCGDSFGTENPSGTDKQSPVKVEHPDYAFNEQGKIFKELQLRNAVLDIKENKGIWTIHFQDNETIKFPQNVLPVILTDESGYWTISGISTGIPVRKNDKGDLSLPSLCIMDDGFWSLDSLHTDFPAETYQSLLNKDGSKTTVISGLLVYGERLYFYLSDKSIIRFPIVKERFYLVPDYWKNHLLEKETMAEKAIEESEGDYNAFVFFTDAHWGNNMRVSPALIHHIVDFTPISDVVFGGDVITTFFPSPDSAIILGLAFQESFSFLGTNFHCLYGNHDNNSSGQASKPENHLSEEQVYLWLQGQMTDVVYGDFYNFYYDNPDSRTRIICLDTGRYHNAVFRDNLPNTVAFAVNALSSVPDGWHIIIASHIWCKSSKQSDGTYTQSLESYIKPLLKVFDNYNARLAGQYTYKKKQSVTYDFSNAKGTIEFCIGGHTHGDFITQSEGGIPIVIVISDSFKTPKKGTTDEQSVTMTIADYKNRKLRMFVVGRGSDREIKL